MPIARATDNLSDDGRAIMVRGFDQRWPVARIVQAIKDQTGEELAPRTVARRAAEWRAEVDRRKFARERMRDLVDAMRAGNMDASEIVQALATDHLIQHPEALTGADPIELQSVNLKAEELRLKRRQLAIREGGLKIAEDKLRMAQEREQRAIAAVADETEALTPEQRIERIKEIYGL